MYLIDIIDLSPLCAPSVLASYIIMFRSSSVFQILSNIIQLLFNDPSTLESMSSHPPLRMRKLVSPKFSTSIHFPLHLPISVTFTMNVY